MVDKTKIRNLQGKKDGGQRKRKLDIQGYNTNFTSHEYRIVNDLANVGREEGVHVEKHYHCRFLNVLISLNYNISTLN